METKLNIKYLVAAAICASRENTRYDLNGVLVEMTAAGNRFIATDGRRLVVLFDEDNPGENTTKVLASAIIPLKACAHKIQRETLFNRKSTPKPNEGRLSIDGSLVRITANGMTYEVPAIDGTYPEWRKIVPDTTSGEASTYNGKLLSDFQRINAIFGDKQVCSVSHNGDGASIVHLTYFVKGFGIIMPMKNAQREWALPEWAGPWPKSGKEVAAKHDERAQAEETSK